MNWDAIWEEYDRHGWVASLTLAEKQIIQNAVERHVTP